MVTIIGVKFRGAGKVYYFDPGDKKLSRGVSVIVETSRGTEMGTVIVPNKEVEDNTVVQPLKPVIRVANDEDFAVIKANKEKQKEAFAICREKIQSHGLEMKLVDVEYTFDNNKILFYFTADGRIDFRDLVKDLASVFKTRIELRQIGVRDETKMLGGIGICGRGLCCATYLSDFVPVSIRMAKEQNLSLNPTKISGVCGRLMCCLKNEEDTYEYLNSHLPSVGESVIVRADNVRGEVQSVNVLKQKVKVILHKSDDDIEIKEYPVAELKFYNRKRKGEDPDLEEEAAEVKVDSVSETEEAVSVDHAEKKEEHDHQKASGEGENRERRSLQNRSEDGENRERRNRQNRSEDGENREHRGRQNRAEDGENREQRRGRQNRAEDGENREQRRGRQNRAEDGENREQRRGRQNRAEDGENREQRRGRQNRAEDGENREQRGRQSHLEDGENREQRGRQNRAENGENREQRSRQNRAENGERREHQNSSEGEKRERRNRERRNERRDGDKREVQDNPETKNNAEKNDEKNRSVRNRNHRDRRNRMRHDEEASSNRSENSSAPEGKNPQA